METIGSKSVNDRLQGNYASNQKVELQSINGQKEIVYVKEKNLKVTYEDNSWYYLLAISVFIILIAWLIFAILSIESIPQVYAENTTGGQVLISCPLNQCATNIYNGEKRCPEEGTQIVSNAGFEVCNPAQSCTSSITPYALLSNLSTNQDGQCQAGITCRCLKRPQCAEYIMSAFETNTGNPYTSVQSSRTSFTQFINSDPSPDVTDGSGNPIITNNTPISYIDDGQKFCTVPIEWIARSTPGCGAMTTINPDSVSTCMTTGNPCTRGALAYITDSSDTFSEASIDAIPVGCVAGNPCAPGQITLFDTKINNIVCKIIST